MDKHQRSHCAVGVGNCSVHECQVEKALGTLVLLGSLP